MSNLRGSDSIVYCVLGADAVIRDDAMFPPGLLDANGEQVDLRPQTSWTSKITSVPLAEMLEVQMINQVVPFEILNKLLPLMEKVLARSLCCAFN